MATFDIDELLNDPVGAIQRRRQRRKEETSLPPLTAEERQSLASQIGSGVVSGLSAVGNLLDLPGSVVRDVLALQNPLDQFLSPLTARNRTTGRDLLRKMGAVGQKDNYGNWWGGLGAEIALDPLTYLTFGGSALTKGGQVAKNAGLLAKATRTAGKAGIGARALRTSATLDDIIRLAGPGSREAAEQAAQKLGVNIGDIGSQNVGGLVGIGLPFQQPFAVLGKRKAGNELLSAAQKFAPTPERARIAKELAAFRPAEEIEPILSVADAYARSWAAGTGKSPDEYFAGLNFMQGGTPGPGALPQAAFHGSPHRFDKFSTEKIGTGEGAQAFGWGLYFSGDEAVAKFYQDGLAPGRGDKPIDMAARIYQSLPETMGEAERRVAVEDEIVRRMHGSMNHVSELRAKYKQAIAAAEPETAKELSRLLDIQVRESQEFIERSNQAIKEARSGSLRGHRYEVDLKPADDEYLLWDAPLSQQSEKVRNALRESGFEPGTYVDESGRPIRGFGTGTREMKGSEAYDAIRWGIADADEAANSQKEASQHLKSLGVRGIKYPANSRKGRDGEAFNYVLFDDADVEITKMYQRAQQGGAVQGSYEMLQSGERVIRALSNPDASTIPHEVWHDFLEQLPKLDAKLADEAAKALGADSFAKMGVPQREQWARAGEDYLRTGRAPSSALQQAFDKFKQWLVSIYQSIIGTPLANQMNPELRKVFDSMLTKGDPQGIKVGTPLARGLDVVDEVLRYGKYSPVRHATALFDHSAMGAATQRGQEIARGTTDRAAEASAMARGSVANFVRQMSQSGKFDVATQAGKDNYDHLLRSLEGVGGQGGAIGPLPSHLAEFQPMVSQIRSTLDDLQKLEEDAGLFTKALADQFGILYNPRRPSQFAATPGLKGLFHDLAGGPGRKNRVLQTTHPFQQGRDDVLRDIPGGTDTLNRLSRDAALSGIVKRQGLGNLTKQHVDALEQVALSRYPELAQLVPGGGQPNRLRPLLRYMAKLDPRFADEGVPLFNRSLLENIVARVEHGHRAIGGAKAVQELLAEFADVTPEGTNIGKLLQGMGLTDKAAEKIALAKGVTLDEIKAMNVPDEIAKDATRFIKSFSAPEEVSTLVRALDAFTNSFKGAVTTVFPAFHVRNLFSGQFNNFVIGAGDPTQFGPAKYLKPMQDAHALMQGKVMQGASKVPGLGNLTDEAATQQLANEAFSYGLFGRHHGLASEVAGSQPIGTFAEELPGIVKASPGEAIKELATTNPQAWNPLRTQGVGATEDIFAPMRAGRDMGHYIEGLNRLAPYIGLRKQGLSPAEAARRVLLAQADYGALSAFERNVMRRVAPFYTFSRRMGEFLIPELMQRPGGKLSQTVRGTNRTRTDDRPLPEHIAQTIAAPVGDIPGISKTPEGFERYLTGLGLAHEDILGLFPTGATSLDTASNFLSELAGRLNPVAKGPLEIAAGKQFFTGRDMRDLDPNVGRIIANVAGQEDAYDTPRLAEQVLANTPLARVLTTARTLTDRREGRTLPAITNLLTGIRLTDVDTEKAKDIAIRERLTELLRGKSGVRHFESLYAPDPERLSANDALLMSLYRQNLLEQQRAKRAPAKKRKKKGPVDELLADVLP